MSLQATTISLRNKKKVSASKYGLTIEYKTKQKKFPFIEKLVLAGWPEVWLGGNAIAYSDQWVWTDGAPLGKL